MSCFGRMFVYQEEDGEAVERRVDSIWICEVAGTWKEVNNVFVCKEANEWTNAHAG